MQAARAADIADVADGRRNLCLRFPVTSRVRTPYFFHKSNAKLSSALDAKIDEHYQQVEKAVAGECAEPG